MPDTSKRYLAYSKSNGYLVGVEYNPVTLVWAKEPPKERGTEVTFIDLTHVSNRAKAAGILPLPEDVELIEPGSAKTKAEPETSPE